MTTFTVAGYAALLLALPFLLYQAYAFVLPAFSPRERKVALPLMLMVPALFLAGVAFGYFVALPRADPLPADLQRRQLRHPHPRHGLLQVRDRPHRADRAALPDPGRRAGRHAPGHHQRAPARQEPRLRDPGDRGRRRGGHADARSGDDAHRDGAAARALRAQRPARRGSSSAAARAAEAATSAGTSTTTCPYPRSDALRPSRPRTAPHRTSHLPLARHPHGRRPRPVRHRRRHHGGLFDAISGSGGGNTSADDASSRSASTPRARSSRPTRRTPPRSRRDQAALRRRRAPARTTTRPSGPTPRRASRELRQASRGLGALPRDSSPPSPTPTPPTSWSRPTARRPQAVRQGRHGPGDRHRQPQGDARTSTPSSRSWPPAPSRTARARWPRRRPLDLTPKDQRKQLKSADRPAEEPARGRAADPATERLSHERAATMPAPRPCSSTGRAADS